MKSYTHILLDADGTLFDFDRSERIALRQAVLSHNIEWNEKYIDVYHRVNAQHWQMLERGEISKDELVWKRFEKTFEILGLSLDPHIFWREYEKCLSGVSILMPGAEKVCSVLSHKYRLHIITNGLRNVQEKRFAASPLTQYFDDIFISDAIGYEKPDIRFFSFVLDTIKANADECLVVGDSLTSDIKGAENAGIDACWLNKSGISEPPDAHISYVIGDIIELISPIQSEGLPEKPCIL